MALIKVAIISKAVIIKVALLLSILMKALKGMKI